MHKPTLSSDVFFEAVLDVWSRAPGEHWLPITGRSMYPLLRDGDHIRIIHGYAGLQRGDIAVFQCERGLIAHRVILLSETDMVPIFVTKGDNRLRFDPPTPRDRIVGRVVAIKRCHRYISLQTPAWRLIGWLIAISAVPWQRVDRWHRALNHRFVGTWLKHPLTFLGRCLLTLGACLRRAMPFIDCR